MTSYCRTCGSPLIKQIPDMDTHERMVCNTCGYIDYINPNIITGVLPVYHDTILLCKRAIDPQKNRWTIPSGFMECNETVEAGALREAYEEAGITPTIRHLYCLYNLPHVGQVYLLYLADLSSSDTDPGIETLETHFFQFSDIPWADIAFSSVSFALKHYVSDYPTQQFPFRTGTYMPES